MLTIAEELLLVGTDARGRNLLSSHRGVALAGAFLTELALREHLAVDERRRLRVVPAASTGEPLLDAALVSFTRREGKKPQDVLDKVGRELLQPTLDSLARQELVRPEPVRVVGLTMGTRWPVLAVGRRDAVLADLARVLTGERGADSLTGALIALLQAVGVLTTVVGKELRPGLGNGDVRRRAKEVLRGRWAPESVAKAVEQAAAATAAVVAASGAVAGSS